ncbi:hypothetical protein BB559_005618 [Furculomyces boomerangus]|nr:hypothetical protein BB559_005618 [Furculomyces boomerangus]
MAAQEQAENTVKNEANVDPASLDQQTEDSIKNETTVDPVSEDQQDVKGSGQNLIKVKILIPNGFTLKLHLNGIELVQELKQLIFQSPQAIEYTCFDLLYHGIPLDNHLSILDVVGAEFQNSAAGDDSVPEASVPEGTEIELEIHEKLYTERDARVHISRLNDLLEGASLASDTKYAIDLGSSIFPILNEKISGKRKGTVPEPKKKKNSKTVSPQTKQPKFRKFNVNSSPQLSIISTVPWRNRMKPEQCIKSLFLSGWNPVRPDRYLKGDLLYLCLTTLENVTYHITSSTTGFYVNKSSSTKFDPSPSESFKPTHSLITLIRRMSLKFTKAFVNMQVSMDSLYPLETVSINSCNQLVAPWIVPHPREGLSTAEMENVYDVSKTQNVFLKLGSRGADAVRDWNEELQSIREMQSSPSDENKNNSTSDYEGAVKDNQMLVWQNEFAEAAIAGAMAVVDNEVSPLNPTELPEQHIYMRENIFFSRVNDSRDLFSSIGGDEAAYTAASKDVNGVQILNGFENNKLCQLGTVMVDFRGCRIVAQTIVPGILRTENENPVVYGSVDNGNNIKSDPVFHELIKPIAKNLRLKEHEIMDGTGAIHKLYTSIDVKGIKGTDGRNYLVDLFRLFPVDSEFLLSECESSLEGSDDSKPRYPHKLVLLRNELLTLFYENSIRIQVKEILAEREKEKEVNPENPEIPKDLANEEFRNDVEKTHEKALESVVSMNMDAYVPILTNTVNAEFNKEKFSEDETVTTNVSKFLNDTIIPGFINELMAANLAPITGKSLTKHMHNRGINMRYLGKIISLLLQKNDKSTDAIIHLIAREMVTRSIKHIIRSFFKNTLREFHPSIFALVINSLFDADISSEEFTETKNQLFSNELLVNGDDDSISNQILTLIKDNVFMRYRYELPENWTETYIDSYKRILLREICIKCGVQILLRNYEVLLSNKKSTKSVVQNGPLSYFSSDDVLNFTPIIKVAGTPVPLPSETLDFGRSMIADGKKEIGLSLLHNLCLLHEQKCGNLHPSTARCYADLGTIYHELEDNETAIELMHQSIIANERSSGVDDTETIYNYLNLAMFEFSNGRTEIALGYIYHALDLWKLVGTLNHPILSVIYSNIAAMHQQLIFDPKETPKNSGLSPRTHNQAIDFFELGYNLRQNLFGDQNLLTASSLLNLAKSIASTGEFKLAMSKAKTAYMTFNKLVGPEDPRTADSKEWVDRLTTLAVESAKNAKAAAEAMFYITPNVESISKESSTKTKGSQTKPDSKNKKKQIGNVNEMSIDDLYQYIVGGNVSSGNTISPNGKGDHKPHKK